MVRCIGSNVELEIRPTDQTNPPQTRALLLVLTNLYKVVQKVSHRESSINRIKTGQRIEFSFAKFELLLILLIKYFMHDVMHTVKLCVKLHG